MGVRAGGEAPAKEGEAVQLPQGLQEGSQGDLRHGGEEESRPQLCHGVSSQVRVRSFRQECWPCYKAVLLQAGAGHHGGGLRQEAGGRVLVTIYLNTSCIKRLFRKKFAKVLRRDNTWDNTCIYTVSLVINVS